VSAGVDPGPPVTLRLAVADPIGSPTAAFVDDFLQRVGRLSSGNVTVVPTLDAGGDTTEGFEQGVAALVKRGDADLGLTGSRMWDLAGVTSLQAFQAPFLIDNDALALAVARSDVAQQALDGMAGGGIVGLALWPQELRHLFWFPRCGRDFRTLDGIAGATIEISPSAADALLVETLGGTVNTGTNDRRGADVDACRLHGMLANTSGVGLPRLAVAAANLVLHPRSMVLVANAQAINRLSAAQAAVVRQAAAESRATALELRPTEPDLARQNCANGGRFLVATDGEVAGLVAAVQPVYAVMERDPLTKALVEDIRALKASTPTSASAAACGTDAGPAPSDSTGNTTDYRGTAFPEGSYRAVLTTNGLMAQGATAAWAAANAGVYTWTFRDGKVTWGTGKGCEGTYESVNGGFVRLITGGSDACDAQMDLLWSLDADGIRFVQIHLAELSAQDFKDISIFMDRRWTKIE